MSSNLISPTSNKEQKHLIRSESIKNKDKQDQKEIKEFAKEIEEDEKLIPKIISEFKANLTIERIKKFNSKCKISIF